MGARAYYLIDKYARYVKNDIVEIGSERGEGSTNYLASFSVRNKNTFYSVDPDPDSYDRARNTLGCKAYGMTGENFLFRVYPYLPVSNHKIGFLYLDGFDWIWEGHSKEGYILAQIDRYRSWGADMNNLNSKISHLRCAGLAEMFMGETALVLIDDTWGEKYAGFEGKGGYAVPYLIECCGFEVVECEYGDNPFVMAGRGL